MFTTIAEMGRERPCQVNGASSHTFSFPQILYFDREKRLWPSERGNHPSRQKGSFLFFFQQILNVHIPDAWHCSGVGDTAEDKTDMHALLDLNSSTQRWTINKISKTHSVLVIGAKEKQIR